MILGPRPDYGVREGQRDKTPAFPHWRGGDAAAALPETSRGLDFLLSRIGFGKSSGGTGAPGSGWTFDPRPSGTVTNNGSPD